MKVQIHVTHWNFVSSYGKKKLGAYFGNFEKWSKSVFRGLILMKLGFFGRLFPKVYIFWTNLLIIFAVNKILIAVSSLQLQFIMGNLNFCEIIFRYRVFSGFIIFFDHKLQFFTVSYFFSLVFCVKRRVFARFLVINEVSQK